MKNSQFSERQQKALELLASGESFGNVAKVVGVSKTAVQTWGRKKAFADALLVRRVAIASGQDPAPTLAPSPTPQTPSAILSAVKIEDLEALSVQYMELVLRSSITHQKPNPTAFKIAMEALKRVGKVGAIPRPPENPIDEFSFEIIQAHPKAG